MASRPTGRLLLPGKCDKCLCDIIRGVTSFHAHKCHEHVVCTKCWMNRDGDDTDDECLFCTVSEEPLQDTKPEDVRPRIKSSDDSDLPQSPTLTNALSKEDNLPKDASFPEDAKIALPSPVNTPLFVETTIGTIVLEMSKETATRKLCCWNTSLKDHVVVGDLGNTITVFAADGTHTNHTLTKGSAVHGGVSISNEKSIVHTSNPDSVFTINLDPESKEPTELAPIHALDVDFPVCVFPISSTRYAVLCTHPSRIEVFLLKDIFVKTKPKPIETLNIDLPDPDALDRACVHVLDVICVSSYKEGVLYVYNLKGERIGVLSRKEDSVFIKRKKNVTRPRSVQCLSDGAVAVTCEAGDVHRVRNIKVSMACTRTSTESNVAGTWDCIKEKTVDLKAKANYRNFTKCGIFTESKLWILDKKSMKTYNTSS